MHRWDEIQADGNSVANVRHMQAEDWADLGNCIDTEKKLETYSSSVVKMRPETIPEEEDIDSEEDTKSRTSTNAHE